ncbi:hypothetical protein [uncultured Ruminococcus sp.]|uniref:hypothetical protein n=1 Tax=uncultured Ruminococcus sp. TaxID=165186 RepID=UPI0025DCA119|nr:hypothetical protein [uncultured Ruminococcus sp.]
MRKTKLIAAAAASAVALAGCGKQDYAVTYGKSEIYTQADMNSAVMAIEEKFKDFKGCDLEWVCYGGDGAVTTDNLDWINELGEAQGKGRFDEVIEFESTFRTPRFGGDDAWEHNKVYEGWQWWLGREKGGEWQVMSWGYG